MLEDFKEDEEEKIKEITENIVKLIPTLIDKKIIHPDELFGSWAGAYGNFQFMPKCTSKK